MPIMDITLWSGRTREQKEALVEAITKEMVRILKVKPESVQIIFHDIERNNWGINGRLQDKIES